MLRQIRPAFILLLLFFLSATIMLVFQRYLYAQSSSEYVHAFKSHTTLKNATLQFRKTRDKTTVSRRHSTESSLGKSLKTSMGKRKYSYSKSIGKILPTKFQPKVVSVSRKSKTHKAKGSYGGYQKVNDNMTFVYAGYYDNRDRQAVVKVITLAPRDIRYYFTCVVSYQAHPEVRVRGYIKYHHASCCGFYSKQLYKDAFIICPVSRSLRRPSFVSIHKDGREFPKTNVTVRVPSAKRNTLTLCGKPFLKKYDKVSQIVWNIELLRLYGVDKFIFYLDSQSQKVVDMFQTYEREGIAELRNVSIRQPGSPIDEFVKTRNYGQFAVNNDCILSEMHTAKYVLFIDVDEMVVPRKHATIVNLADDLFTETKHARQHAGSLLFRNVYFPSYLEKTKIAFPRKDLALKYNIQPLLYTTRLGSSDLRISPKSLVRPGTVDIMCVHQVERFRPGWHRKIVEEDIAILHHYRQVAAQYMFPPESQDPFVLKMSDQLISAVDKRFKSTGIKP